LVPLRKEEKLTLGHSALVLMEGCAAGNFPGYREELLQPQRTLCQILHQLHPNPRFPKKFFNLRKPVVLGKTVLPKVGQVLHEELAFVTTRSFLKQRALGSVLVEGRKV
jgi:hypothetical protein